jgi:hypothetical protein
MKRTKYKGIVDPGKIPNTRTDNSDSDMEPAYVKKYLKPEKRIEIAAQLKLFGNPYDTNY